MKKIFTLTVSLIIVALFSFNQSLSQTLNEGDNNRSQIVSDILATGYTFTYSTGTYANLTGATNMSAGVIWDYNSFACPIGFTFKFFNTSFDTARVSDPNDVDFGAKIGGGYKYFITPYGVDLVDRAFGDGTTTAKSPISYTLTDTAPNRILKIEWKNAAFLDEIKRYSTRTNYINLQLWLYETSNNIEIHFGPQNVTYLDSIYLGNSGPNISLNNHVNSKYLSLIGSVTNPTVSTTPELYITGTPPNGMIYKFASNYVSIADKASRNYSIYPNPTHEMINIMLPEKLDWANVQVYNLLGNELLNKKFLHTNLINLNINSLPPGTYLLKLRTPETVITQKITKQ